MQHIKSVKKIANVYAIKKSGRGYKMENMKRIHTIHVDTNQIIRPKTLDDFFEEYTYTGLGKSNSIVRPRTARLTANQERPRYNFESSFVCKKCGYEMRDEDEDDDDE